MTETERLMGELRVLSHPTEYVISAERWALLESEMTGLFHTSDNGTPDILGTNLIISPT